VSDEQGALLRPLACPYCGGKLTVDTETTGRAYLSYEAPESIVCDEMGCGAAWETDGTSRDLPGFVRHPSLYAQPAGRDTDRLRDVLRVHHPTMLSETGPFSGCRCGQVKLGQDVIAHVVGHLHAALRETTDQP
jgi:uncharacterized protein YbaR (Trm112 family)